MNNVALVFLLVSAIVGPQHCGVNGQTRSPAFGSLFPPSFGDTPSPFLTPLPIASPEPAPIAPVIEPTFAPAPVPVPVVAPTLTPTQAPVVPSTPVVVPTPTAPPIVVPVPVLTATPTTLSPTTLPPATPAPTIAPSTLPPTRPPPVTPPPSASEVPSAVPSLAPLQSVDETVSGLLLVYPNVSYPLSADDLALIENITAVWFTDYFGSTTERRRRAKLMMLHHRSLRGGGDNGAPFQRQLRVDLLNNFTTTIDIQDQGPMDPTNTSTFIIYNQTLQYQAQPGADTAANYSLLPFASKPAVQEYTDRLIAGIPGFANVSSIEAPEIGGRPPAVAPTAALVPVSPPSKDDGDDGLPPGVIAGIAVAVLVVLVVGGVAAAFLLQNNTPKSALPLSVVAPDGSTLASQRSTLTRKYSRVEKGLVVAYAPPGKLGFSLDKPDEGPLVIYVVKEDSPLAGLIQPNDRLVAVDEENVRIASPARVVGMLKERSTNPWRKMTLMRNDETTANDPEGQYIVYAPAEKLGFSLEKTDEDVPPVVRTVKSDSILLGTVEIGDQLLGIDEVNVESMSASETVATLLSRKSNPSRKLTLMRPAPIDRTPVLPEELGDEGLYIAFAPSGRLGFSLQSPDEDFMIVHAIKEDSPLMNQVQTGDRLVGIDEVDVRSLSPTRVVNLLSARKANVNRKLTLVRRGADVVLGESLQIEEGTIVIYVPAGKLGFSLHSPDDGPPLVQSVKDNSILSDTVQVGDRLMSLDENDTSKMHAGKVVKLLVSRKENPYRKIAVSRGVGAATYSSSGDKTTYATSVTVSMGTNPVDTNLYVVKAPAGKLGVILDNPDEGPPVIHSVKDTSVLLGQLAIGDRLMKIDDVDVSAFSPAQVVQILSTKGSNPVRLLTLSRVVAAPDPEPEIVLRDGESTISGGESLIVAEEGDNETDDGVDNE
jgi:C-terminal processing protease CtpA/Prc